MGLRPKCRAAKRAGQDVGRQQTASQHLVIGLCMIVILSTMICETILSDKLYWMSANFWPALAPWSDSTLVLVRLVSSKILRCKSRVPWGCQQTLRQHHVIEHCRFISLPIKKSYAHTNLGMSANFWPALALWTGSSPELSQPSAHFAQTIWREQTSSQHCWGPPPHPRPLDKKDVACPANSYCQQTSSRHCP